MPAQITAELLRLGLPGIVIAALAWAYWRKEGECQALHAAAIAREQKCRDEMTALHALRASDLQASQQQLVQASVEGVGAMNNVDASLEGNRVVLTEVRDAFAGAGLGDRGSLAHTIDSLRASVDALVASGRAERTRR